MALAWHMAAFNNQKRIKPLRAILDSMRRSRMQSEILTETHRATLAKIRDDLSG